MPLEPQPIRALHPLQRTRHRPCSGPGGLAFRALGEVRLRLVKSPEPECRETTEVPCPRILDPSGDRVGEDGEAPVIVAGEVCMHSRTVGGCNGSHLGRHLGHRRSGGRQPTRDGDGGSHGDSPQECPAEVPSTARCYPPSHHMHSLCHRSPVLSHPTLVSRIVLRPCRGEPGYGGSAQLARPAAHGNGPRTRKVAPVARVHLAVAWLRNVTSARKTAGRTNCTRTC